VSSSFVAGNGISTRSRKKSSKGRNNSQLRIGNSSTFENCIDVRRHALGDQRRFMAEMPANTCVEIYGLQVSYRHPTLQSSNETGIGTLQRNACGYRDDEYLTLRILNIHKATYALTG